MSSLACVTVQPSSSGPAIQSTRETSAFPENGSIVGDSLEQDYQGKTVRALMVDGVPHYCLADMVAALGWPEESMAEVDSPNFPSWAKMLAGEGDNPDAVEASPDMVLLSPIGVFYWGDLVDRWKAQSITAWAKRESRRICPEPVPGDPAMFLSLTQGADGWVYIPPGPPGRYSGWKCDWEELKWAGCGEPWRAAEENNRELDRKWREERRAANGEVEQPRKPLGLDLEAYGRKVTR